MPSARKVSMNLESKSFLDLSVDSVQPPQHRHRLIHSSQGPSPLRPFLTIDSLKQPSPLKSSLRHSLLSRSQNKPNPYESVSQVKRHSALHYQADNESLLRELQDRKETINYQKGLIKDMLTKQRSLEQQIRHYERQAMQVGLNYEEENHEIFGINFQNKEFMQKHQAVLLNKEIKYQRQLRHLQSEVNRYRIQYENIERDNRTQQNRQLRKDLEVQTEVNIQLRQQYQNMDRFPSKSNTDQVQRMFNTLNQQRHDQLNAQLDVLDRKNKTIQNRNGRLLQRNKDNQNTIQAQQQHLHLQETELETLRQYRDSTQQEQRAELKGILEEEYQERMHQKETVIEYQLQAQKRMQVEMQEKYDRLEEQYQLEKISRMEIEQKHQEATHKYKVLAQNFCESQLNRHKT